MCIRKKSENIYKFLAEWLWLDYFILQESMCCYVVTAIVLYFPVRLYLAIVDFDGPPSWSLDATLSHHPYPRAFCTLPSFACIKRPRMAARRTQRSTSTISRKNRGLWTVYYSDDTPLVATLKLLNQLENKQGVKISIQTFVQRKGRNWRLTHVSSPVFNQNW